LASRSGQSARLTNSNSASATPAPPGEASSGGRAGSGSVLSFLLRRTSETGSGALAHSSGGACSSAAGVVADWRKSWRDSATLRPMPAVGGWPSSVVVGDEVSEEESEESRRGRGPGVREAGRPGVPGLAAAAAAEARGRLAGMVSERGAWWRTRRLRGGERTAGAEGPGEEEVDGTRSRRLSTLLEMARRSTAGEGMDDEGSALSVPLGEGGDVAVVELAGEGG
jgi:hypothetical protein